MRTIRWFTIPAITGAILALALTLTAPAAAQPAAISRAVPAVKTAVVPARQAPARPAVPARVYRARPGDSLSSIASRDLGSAARWPALWWANRRAVRNPSLLLTGTLLVIPASGTVTPRIRHAAYDAAGALPVAPSPPGQPQAGAPPAPGGSYGPVPASFFNCVEQRESGGYPAAYNSTSGASGLFGMLLTFWDGIDGGYFGRQYPGGAHTAPAGVQVTAFEDAYAEDGPSPWRPFDGC